MNQGVHLVDLALWLLGDVEEVYAPRSVHAYERIETTGTAPLVRSTEARAAVAFIGGPR